MAIFFSFGCWFFFLSIFLFLHDFCFVCFFILGFERILKQIPQNGNIYYFEIPTLIMRKTGISANKCPHEFSYCPMIFLSLHFLADADSFWRSLRMLIWIVR